MRLSDITRAWKDEDYRLELCETSQNLPPDNPAGLNTLTDEEMAGIEGGTIGISAINITTMLITWITCGITLCACLPANCGWPE